MTTTALMICVAGLLNLPAPDYTPMVIEVKTAQLQELCPSDKHWLRFGCYHPTTQSIFIDGARVLKDETISHELAHHIVIQAGQHYNVPHSEVRWAADRAEVRCR